MTRQKPKWTRLMAMLLSVIMALLAVPLNADILPEFTVYAEEGSNPATSVEIAGIVLNAENPYAVADADGTVSAATSDDYNIHYDAETGVLTLNNVSISTDADASVVKFSKDGDAEIHVMGTVSLTYTGTKSGFCIDNGTEQSLKIYGDGNLTVNGKKGICAYNVSIVETEVTFNSNGGDAIFAYNDLSIQSSFLTEDIQNAANRALNYAKHGITFENSNITVTFTDCDKCNVVFFLASYKGTTDSVDASRRFTVKDSAVQVVATNSNRTFYMLATQHADIIFESSTLTCESTANIWGLVSMESALAGGTSDNALKRDVTVTDSTIKVPEKDRAIYSQHDINITQCAHTSITGEVYVTQSGGGAINTTNLPIENGFCSCGEYQEAVQVTAENCESLGLTADFIGYYAISNAGELYWFMEYVNAGNGNETANAVLVNDIVVNEGTMTENSTDARKWFPIGYYYDRDSDGTKEDISYKGTFDGQNHTISGLYFNSETQGYVGLFGVTNQDASIQNVGVIHSYIKGSGRVGGVCGTNWSGTISNCYSTGDVSGTDRVGGVCGTNWSGTISNCYSTGAVSGTDRVGGVCGENYRTITNCYNTGDVSGTDYVGGVCGYNRGGTFKNCYYQKDTETYFGIGTIWDQDSGTTKQVTEDTAGETMAKTTEAFASGEVAYLLQQGQEKPSVQVWGQEIGKDVSPVLNGVTVYNHGTTYTNFVSTIEHNFDENGFCIVTCDVYEEPELVEGVYQIANAGNLYWFMEYVNAGNGNETANAVLVNDIVVNEGTMTETSENVREWFPIGYYHDRDGDGATEYISYNGTFDGQNHTISGLYFNNEDQSYVGLFGRTNQDASIQNVGVIHSYIKGNNVGSVCGNNEGTITNCYNTGDVSGKNFVGGVCGYNNGGKLTNCYSTGTGTGEYANIGGVCGFNKGTLTNCYDTGDVSGADYVGGVCAGNVGTITNCYYRKDTETYFGIGATTEDTAGETIAKTTEAFASGEVAYLLQQGQEDSAVQVWYQEIGKDPSPVLDGDQVVYYGYASCASDAEMVYTNDSKATSEKWEHNFDENGFCTICDAYEEPKLVEGVYQIANAGNLYWFMEYVNAGNGNETANAVLVNDIVVNEGTMTETSENVREWFPIGYWHDRDGDGTAEDIYYNGTFDGQNHTISGLYFNNENQARVGLFGRIEENASIQNVGVIHSYIKGEHYVGSVCGRNYGGTISNCYNTGAVSGTNYVGGVCGRNGGSGTISNCYNTGAVSGTDYVGGVCGRNGGSGTISNCYNTGAVTGTGEYAYIGGVCGRNSDGGTISNCYNTGAVTGTGEYAYIGGVCGDNNYGTITNCYNTGAVSGTGDVGGVCGFNYGGMITNCYYRKDTETYFGIGVIEDEDSGAEKQVTEDTAGKTMAKTTEAFASGEVAYLLQQGQEDSAVQVWYQEIGKDPSPVLDGDQVVYYGYISCASDAEMVYTNDSKAASEKWEHNFDENGFCTICDAYEEPKLVEGVYQIANAGNLYWFMEYVNAGNGNETANAVLVKDIVVNEGTMTENSTDARKWFPIGYWHDRDSDGTEEDIYYKGTFDGQNHTISGLYFNNEMQGYVGLFGHTNQNASIQNVGVIHSYIKGKKFVGSVCAYNYGTITNCYNTGAVTGTGFSVGGVCGENHGTITNCYNTGAVSGTGDVGGVCGYNEGTLTNCYSTGVLSGTGDSANVGGVCAGNVGTITNCYYRKDTETYFGIGKIWDDDSKKYKQVTEDTVGETIAKTTEVFASGEVAYLLQQGQEDPAVQVWYQEIGKDPSPVLDGDQVVYYGYISCASDAEMVYTNDSKAASEKPAHTGGTATCTEKAVCDVCHEEYGELLEHTLQAVSAKDASCTETGNLAYWQCSVCGAYFSDADGETETTLEAVTIPKTEHDYTKYVDNEDGKTHRLVCVNCDDVKTEAEAHSYEDGMCVCGHVEMTTTTTTTTTVTTTSTTTTTTTKPTTTTTISETTSITKPTTTTTISGTMTSITKPTTTTTISGTMTSTTKPTTTTISGTTSTTKSTTTTTISGTMTSTTKPTTTTISGTTTSTTKPTTTTISGTTTTTKPTTTTISGTTSTTKPTTTTISETTTSTTKPTTTTIFGTTSTTKSTTTTISGTTSTTKPTTTTISGTTTSTTKPTTTTISGTTSTTKSTTTTTISGTTTSTTKPTTTTISGTTSTIKPTTTTTISGTTTSTTKPTTTTISGTTSTIKPTTTTISGTTTSTTKPTTTTISGTTTSTTKPTTTTISGTTSTTKPTTTTISGTTTSTTKPTTTTISETTTSTTEPTTTTISETTTSTTEPTTTTTISTSISTTESTTITTTNTTITTSNSIQTETSIVFELKEANYYFSSDETALQAADLFVSVTLISTDVDGNVVESDILDQVTFNDVTPASLYEQNAPYFAGTVQAYYNGLPIDGATPAVYVGLKGDADLNGKVEVEDAVAILTYYAQKSAALPTVFQEDPMLNTLAYYLADVDTESKLGMNHAASGQSISVEDAVYVLTYYAQTSAALHPSWESILQK